MIEVCLALYQRFDRLPEILWQLLSQTNQNFNVNIWNNCEKNIDWKAISFFPKERLRVEGIGRNLGSCARFMLVKDVKGEVIVFIDDDLVFNNDFIEYNYKRYKEYNGEALCGWFSKVFDKDYRNPIEEQLKNGSEADYIGTPGCIVNKKLFDIDENLFNIPNEFIKVEDLYLSYIARKHDFKLVSIDKKCYQINDGLGQNRKLHDYKQNAFKELREKHNWRLVKENK